VLLSIGHKKDFYDLVRRAALTATRSFIQTVRCISIQACGAGQGGRTDLLVTDPGEPGSRTGGDACRLFTVHRLEARRMFRDKHRRAYVTTTHDSVPFETFSVRHHVELE
jgi:hypothetical protein